MSERFEIELLLTASQADVAKGVLEERQELSWGVYKLPKVLGSRFIGNRANFILEILTQYVFWPVSYTHLTLPTIYSV